MRTRIIVIGLTAVVAVVLLAIVIIPGLLNSKQVPDQALWPTQGWRSSTPEEQGFDSAILADGLLTLQERNVRIDSLLIIRNGYVVLDAYFYPYDRSIPHKLASVTKSVMTTLIGIAIDQGVIQLDQPMVSFFPDREIANLDARKEHVTIRHLVSMQNGFASGCLAGDEATLNQMRSNPDWVQAALDRKVPVEPGTNFCYDSPGMHLLSAILQEATGMTALEFARQNLFEPLSIQEVYWQSDPQGYIHGWGDLYLKPRDAAKIGYLWLNQGVWGEKQIVSARWVADSIEAHNGAGGDGYGYGWWVSDDNFYASGRGGQNIKVYPSYNAIVVTTASGFDYQQIEPLLVAAFVNPNKPLPANPASATKLEETLPVLAQAPNPWPNNPIPEITKQISGKTYEFVPNSVGLETIRLEFGDPEAAIFYLKLQGQDETWTVGLDGNYRISPDGQGLRGYWENPQTFILQIFEEGLSTRRLFFKDDRVKINFPESGFDLEGRME
jgi:CubicO group peptidase (beta-lactamase class C family)